MTEVATAFVTLLPSARGFGAATAAQLGAPLATAGRVGGQRAGVNAAAGMTSSIKPGLSKLAGAFGVTLAAATAVGIGKGIINAAADYEQSQNVLQAALGASGDQMAKLDGLAKQMGAATVYSSLEASDAMIELGKAGLTVDQIMSGGIQSSMALAATEGLNLADAGTAVANAMNAFGINAKDLPSVADALAGASKASTASVSSLMQALQQVGPGAKTAGFSLQETVAVLAAFDNMGLKGSDAGTSLKTMLQRLLPQTNKAYDAFLHYGLITYDAQDAARGLAKYGIKPLSNSYDDVTDAVTKYMREVRGLSGIKAGDAARDLMADIGALDNQFANSDGTFKTAAEMAGVLQEALGGLSEVDLTDALNQLFGSDASRGASILTGLGTEGLDKYLEGANDAGGAAEMAEARTKGFKGAVERLQGSLETLATSIGTNALPALTTMVDWLAEEGVPGLETALSDMGRPFGGLARFMVGWARVVRGAWTALLDWFGTALKTAITMAQVALLRIPGIGPVLAAKLEPAKGAIDEALTAADTMFAGVDAQLDAADGAIDEWFAAQDARDWTKEYELRAKYVYYDPHTGTYYGPGTKDGKPKKPAATTPSSATSSSVKGKPTSVTNNFNTTVNNPKPEKAGDSVSVTMRRKAAVLGW